ncbi:UNKNOWN [Stylonychia lemnae]|uniref:ISXO2-like transposase domain-containing protein n=1 Tax=Stylonychia lemnae TaxID=5949 RepID=A0A077ZMS3_STYLE|nr:UNKNOWN [Stylonychia lemnae]|eukprot:CDW71267.1 UNKNOWN [Stylonychia lemnae]
MSQMLISQHNLQLITQKQCKTLKYFTSQKILIKKMRTHRRMIQIRHLLRKEEKRDTFVWCQQNELIRQLPECPYCEIPMRVSINSKNIHDAREYSCHNKCGNVISIRQGSFLDEFKCTLMELIRIVFYYYCRGYTVETVHKELAFGISRTGGIDMSKQMILDLKKKKLGGAGVEVWMDSYKLNLKTNSGVEEFWIVGFIERSTNRSRAYLTNDIKIDTIALFIAKTVGRHTTLCTPYYHQVGWEFLDKFYDHQRLRKEKGELRKGQRMGGRLLSGFEYMWAQIKELEIVFMKLGEKTRRLKRVKSHLQCYLDEMVWRIECRTLDEKRNYLLKTLNITEWGKYVKRLEKLQKKKQKIEAKNIAEEMMIEMEQEQKKRKKLKRKFGCTNEDDEEDDPMEARRRMFGEESQDSDDSGCGSDDSLGNAREEEEDEFMIVLQAVRERKKNEAENGKILLKDKLSQTGWKLRENFMKKTNAYIDDKDRIDVFNGVPLQQEKNDEQSDNEDDVIILDY